MHHHDEFKLFGVGGSPIAHSLSPTIYNYFFQFYSQNYVYVRLLAKNHDELAHFIHELPWKGINLTSPLKEWERVEKVLEKERLRGDTAVLASGACNCLFFNSKYTCCYNSDIKGILGAFSEIQPLGKASHLLILGAGGAAKSAIVAGQSVGAVVTVLARDKEKAKIVAEAYGAHYDSLGNISDYLPLATHLLSALPNKAWENIDFNFLQACKTNIVILDADYKVAPLAIEARKCGFQALSGESWLAHQALFPARYYTGYDISITQIKTALAAAHSKGRERIALLGFMGAGKSTLLRPLAAALNYDFIDMDVALEAQFQKSIPAIFAENGEAVFRNAEKELLSNLATRSKIVIACGGGIVTSPENVKLLQECFYGLWLVAPLFITCKLLQSSSTRPLFSSNLDAMSSLFKARIPGYAKSAAIIIPNLYEDTETFSHEIAREIF